MGEDTRTNHRTTHRRNRSETKLADSKRVHKLLNLDQWEGVILTMTRRKTVKNRQLGVCGDMYD